MTTIQGLLYNRGFDRNAKVKLVGHKNVRCDLYEKYRTRTNQEWFFAYQSSQVKPVFKDTDEWFEMEITANGNVITCTLNKKQLIETNDDTFSDAGKVGLWTKTGAQTYFNNLSISPKK